jgi:hypothetical protein
MAQAQDPARLESTSTEVVHVIADYLQALSPLVSLAPSVSTDLKSVIAAWSYVQGSFEQLEAEMPLDQQVTIETNVRNQITQARAAENVLRTDLALPPLGT